MKVGKDLMLLSILRTKKKIKVSSKLKNIVKKLEKEGLVSIKNNVVRITKKGEKEIENYVEVFNKFYWDDIIVEGKVVKGKGEGKFFMSLDEYKTQFSKLLGYEPFEGTLNLRIEEKYIPIVEFIKEIVDYNIEGFKKDGKKFGRVKVVKAVISDYVLGAVVFPEKGKHKNNIIEIIGPFNFREFFKLKNMTTVNVKFVL